MFAHNFWPIRLQEGHFDFQSEEIGSNPIWVTKKADIYKSMLAKIKRQCLYKALHRKLAKRSQRVMGAWTEARINKRDTLPLAEENARIHRKQERTESKMWWITRKML